MLTPILLSLLASSHAYAAFDCTSLQVRDEDALYEAVNEFSIQNLERIQALDPRSADSQAQASLIRARVSAEVEKFEQSIRCMKDAKELSDGEFDQLKDSAKAFRKMIASSKINPETHATLDAKLAENDPNRTYSLRRHNRLKYLDTGSEHRDETFETIRTAEKYLHLSYFEFYPDRMGSTMVAALVAKRLGKSTPCGVAEVALSLGLPKPLNFQDCGADSRVVTGPIAESEPQDKDFTKTLPKKKELIARAKALRAANPRLSEVEVKIYLDNSKKSYHQLSSKGLAQVLDEFQVPFIVEGGFSPLNFYNNNHTKIIASEKRAIISGGNPVDKVVDWTAKRRWRDAAILVEGELVNDVNHFFLSKFMRVRHSDLNARLCPDGSAECLARTFPRENMNKEGFNSPGRLIWTSNYDAKVSPTWHALETVVNDAQRSLYFENAFFSDGNITTQVFRKKALAWDLRGAKRINGEDVRKSTCGKDYFDVVARRPGGRHILFVLPKHMDQPAVLLAEKVLSNHLIYWGVDVCKWDSSVDNELNHRSFQERTMMHSKVFMADDRIAYIGTANLNRRSMLGDFPVFGKLVPAADLEIGILTEDPRVVRDVREKMFGADVRATEGVNWNFFKYFYLPVQLTLNLLGFT
ncbi:MAG TPA: phosphatidylserine/phosphatidylglycerophosphate/cardiolipin synthase family protein [Bdellovibrionota bacterium]|nr:phosphatidylserine/phosphatidylglycerophosphate/cardiolipin synthase family protein [Bdellovibrionota bacterium]